MPDIAINNEKFSANDAEVFMYGRVSQEVTEISWKEKQDVTPVKVIGNRKDVGYVRGNHGVEGTIVMLQEGILGLQVSGGGSILNLKGDITLTLVKDGFTVKTTLVNVVMKENGMDIKGGTTDSLQYSIPFYASDVKVFK